MKQDTAIVNPTIMLVDNGSTRAAATLQLRQIASQLSDITNQTIHAVSMQHSDKIPQDIVDQSLSGTAPCVLKSFMQGQLERGNKDFILIPLFFGKSRALTSYVPSVIDALEPDFGSINLKMTDVLYPLPDGDPLIIEILYQHLLSTSKDHSFDTINNAVLVDHGSPIPQVNAVRQHIFTALQKRLPKHIDLKQAAMERRKGKEYDFNGELLEDHLSRQAEQDETQISVLLLFLLAGTHAGENGDIATICDTAATSHGLKISISPLIGQNKILIECLAQKLKKLINNE